jgi:hypothetical protein
VFVSGKIRIFQIFPKFSKNDYIRSWAFQKNLRSVAEDSGKTADQLLSFSKKPQVRS